MAQGDIYSSRRVTKERASLKIKAKLVNNNEEEKGKSLGRYIRR